jgi:hypothetical protein
LLPIYPPNLSPSTPPRRLSHRRADLRRVPCQRRHDVIREVTQSEFSNLPDLPVRVPERTPPVRIGTQTAPSGLGRCSLFSVVWSHPQPRVIESLRCGYAPRHVDSQHTRDKIRCVRIAARERPLVVLPASHAVLRILSRAANERHFPR